MLFSLLSTSFDIFVKKASVYTRVCIEKKARPNETIEHKIGIHSGAQNTFHMSGRKYNNQKKKPTIFEHFSLSIHLHYNIEFILAGWLAV